MHLSPHHRILLLPKPIRTQDGDDYCCSGGYEGERGAEDVKTEAGAWVEFVVQQEELGEVGTEHGEDGGSTEVPQERPFERMVIAGFGVANPDDHMLRPECAENVSPRRFG